MMCCRTELAGLCFSFLSVALLTGCGEPADGDAELPSPFAIRVVSFDPGPMAGFGQDHFPEIVLGPPKGGGEWMGSLDVLSLGIGGEIIVEMGQTIVDGPGPDFLVFENPFRSGTLIFAEPGHVAVSFDGTTFVELACDPEAPPDYPGCAGVNPVFANADTNDIDPTDPEVAGGDPFDLADFGLERARFVRIRDAATGIGFGGESGGFDLDAVAVVNGEL